MSVYITKCMLYVRDERFTMIFLMLMLWLLRHSLNSERAWNRFVFECSKRRMCVCRGSKKFKNAHRIQPFDERDANTPHARRFAMETYGTARCLVYTNSLTHMHIDARTHTCARSRDTQKHTTDCAYSNAHHHHITTTCACDYRARSICYGCWYAVSPLPSFVIPMEWWTNSLCVRACVCVCACTLDACKCVRKYVCAE